MEDLGFKGQMQTWTNNRRGTDWVMERLERVLVNRVWGSVCPQAQRLSGLIVGSNQAPLELDEQRGKIRFRFEEMWFEHVDCFDIIKNQWSSVGHFGEMDDLKYKLAACKSSLIEQSKREFKNSVKEINKVKRQLRNMSERTLNEDELDEENALKSRLNDLQKREELYWKQRSTVKWLTQGDRNTKYFHQTTLARRRTNKIVCIWGLDGAWILGEKGVFREIHSYYQSLFTSNKRQGGPPDFPEGTVSCIQ